VDNTGQYRCSTKSRIEYNLKKINMSNKPTCVFVSPIFSRSGYGGWAYSVAKSLLRYDKFDLQIIPTRWGSCSKENVDLRNDPDAQELLNRVVNGQLTKQPDLFIQMSIPNEANPIGKYNIMMTAGIETTVASPQFIEGLNKMNLGVVMSKHGKDVFQSTSYTKNFPDGRSEELKCTKPLEVLFWGADTSVYNKTDVSVDSVEEVFATVPEEFNFLFVGQWTSGNMMSDRKNIGFLIKTFLETFANTKNAPGLILKTSGATLSVMDKYECLAKINEITQMVRTQLGESSVLPNVYLIHGELSDAEMNALYNHNKVKVHVSFTRGEGWCMPGLLQTLTGKPTIYPEWSGHLDFLNPKHAKLFKGELVTIPQEAVNDWFMKDSKWFEVDYKAAGERLKATYSNYNKMLLYSAEELRKENAEKFSFEAMNKVLHGILDKYVPQFAVETKIILPKLKKIDINALKK